MRNCKKSMADSARPCWGRGDAVLKQRYLTAAALALCLLGALPSHLAPFRMLSSSPGTRP